MNAIKFYSIFIFLVLSFLCPAQKIHRHEITIGYYGGYFFDKAPFRFQQLRRTIPTITYGFNWSKHFSTTVMYGAHSFDGENLHGEQWFNRSNTIIRRDVRHYMLTSGYKVRKRNTNIYFSGGITYRTGAKGTFLHAYDRGNWTEYYSEYTDYGDMGIVSGLSFQHPIFKIIFGEVSANYIRYLGSFDQDFFMAGYKIGVRF